MTQWDRSVSHYMINNSDVLTQECHIISPESVALKLTQLQTMPLCPRYVPAMQINSKTWGEPETGGPGVTFYPSLTRLCRVKPIASLCFSRWWGKRHPFCVAFVDTFRIFSSVELYAEPRHPGADDDRMAAR